MGASVFSTGSAALNFSQMLQSRWPEWHPHVRLGNLTSSEYAAESLYAIIPSPVKGGPVLIVEIHAGEATIGLGQRGAERIFVWDDPAERFGAFVEILNFLDDITTAEVVVVWKGY